MQTTQLIEMSVCRLDWVALATFVGPVAAGLMAIFAAKSVAVKQNLILSEQVKIQSQMANLERHKIRLELLEGRVEFIKSVDGIPDSFGIIKVLPDYKSLYEEKIRDLGNLAATTEYLYGEHHAEYFVYIKNAVNEYFKGKVKSEIYKEHIDYEGDFLTKMVIIKQRTEKEIKPDTRVISLIEQL